MYSEVGKPVRIYDKLTIHGSKFKKFWCYKYYRVQDAIIWRTLTFSIKIPGRNWSFWTTSIKINTVGLLHIHPKHLLQEYSYDLYRWNKNLTEKPDQLHIIINPNPLRMFVNDNVLTIFKWVTVSVGGIGSLRKLFIIFFFFWLQFFW